MKKLLIAILLICCAISTKAQKPEARANVKLVLGIYVYVDSEPISDYEILGRVKCRITWSGQYTQVRNKIITTALKEYPDADGVIIDFCDGCTDRAVVIKFKKATAPHTHDE